jgi:pimeloyl-ACP methyl ester carboxylesterase
MVYSTHSLDVANTTVTRALIMVHGTNRNADHYFATATSAAFLAGALDNTIVIAPHIIASPDKPEADEVVWPNGGDSWRSGGMSTSHPTLSSFDFADEIVRKLANKKTFPNLTKIVVAGHSAGGQFATRYAMATTVHDLPGVSITYVVANPSSYAWPVAERPLPTGDADPATADKAALGPNGEKVHTNFTFGPFDATKAANFNRWPAGLENRKGYTEKMSDDQLRRQLVERPTTYLLGQVDVLPLGGFDSSPNAMAQGPTRRARGEAFFKYLTEKLGAKHSGHRISGDLSEVDGASSSRNPISLCPATRRPTPFERRLRVASGGFAQVAQQRERVPRSVLTMQSRERERGLVILAPHTGHGIAAQRTGEMNSDLSARNREVDDEAVLRRPRRRDRRRSVRRPHGALKCTARSHLEIKRTRFGTAAGRDRKRPFSGDVGPASRGRLRSHWNGDATDERGAHGVLNEFHGQSSFRAVAG